MALPWGRDTYVRKSFLHKNEGNPLRGIYNDTFAESNRSLGILFRSASLILEPFENRMGGFNVAQEIILSGLHLLEWKVTA